MALNRINIKEHIFPTKYWAMKIKHKKWGKNYFMPQSLELYKNSEYLRLAALWYEPKWEILIDNFKIYEH